MDRADEADWEVTPEGLYIATRSFLVRRGYCCANRCLHCPYINWRNQPTWQPLAIERVKRMRVSPKAVAGARALLLIHERQLQQCAVSERSYHQSMIQHYSSLLICWRAQRQEEIANAIPFNDQEPK